MSKASTQLVSSVPRSRIPPVEVNSYRYKNKVIVRISLASQGSAEVVASKIKRVVVNGVQQIFQEAIGQ